MYVYAERKRYELINVSRIGNTAHYRVTCENKVEEVTYTIADLQICRGKLRILPVINDITRRMK